MKKILIVLMLLLIVFVLAIQCHVKNQMAKEFNNKIKILERKLAEEKAKKTIRISDGAVSPGVDVVSSKKLNKLLENLAIKDSRISQLRQKIENQNMILSSATNAKVKVITKVVYRDKPSDQIIGKVYVKNIYSGGLLLSTVKFNTEHLSSPWSYIVHKLSLKLLIMQAVNKNGPDRIGIVGTITDSKNNSSEALIESSSTKYSYPPHKKIKPLKWSIRPFKLELHAGLLFAAKVPVEPGLGLLVSSHLLKLSNHDIDIARFIGLGVGYNLGPNALLISLIPASFNVGYGIPILRDTFISLHFGLGIPLADQDFMPNFIMGITIGTTL